VAEPAQREHNPKVRDELGLPPRVAAFKSTIRLITDSTIDWPELAGQINHLETCPGRPTRFAGGVGVVKKPGGTDRSLPQRLSDFQSH
jgi:hypothetical protein